MRAKQGKQLGGKPRGGRWTRPTRPVASRRRSQGISQWLVIAAVGLFAIGAVAGFGWALDRQVRGGVLQQQTEARQRADWVSLESLPRYVPLAFAAVVDPSYLEQGAVRAGDNGGTLARALVRQVHMLGNDLPGEARELLMGPLLEQRASREALLELYLNRAHLGEEQGWPVFGIYHAAQEYFDKEPKQLTLGEAATLAGLLLPPQIMDPEERPGAVGVRRNEVLRVLLLGGVISEGEYAAAVREPLAFQPGLGDQPMTRPADWMEPARVIRLPPSRLPTDSAEVS